MPETKVNIPSFDFYSMVLVCKITPKPLQVRKSMCRIKHVLTERAIEEPDPRRSVEMKRMINAL
ncbi:hypothetical protein CK203_076598 [Vitis vinifera]|uniref:Uncharacterized protein n=1 Tax=Vitis vinifera TaxID=29760 RepID=A0A438EYF8_VITVI|nr:hypothetical protein CK203_076598 [Vitis vinifera]